LQPSASKNIDTQYCLNSETQMAQLKNAGAKRRKIDSADANSGDFYKRHRGD